MIESQQEYCNKYFVPEEYLWEILEDSKVVPMIRGKATEYSAYLFLRGYLDNHKFSVDKLNLNAQPGAEDEDVSITHRATGIRLRIEVKNACRGEFTDGKRCKILKNIPHFKVKCHRSRSNMDKANTTNDRYVIGDFDLLVTNTLNAIYKGETYTSDFEFISEKRIKILKEYYQVATDRELEEAASQDWRFAFPEDIAEECNGVLAIPRTPYVALENDEHWFKVEDLSERLERKAIEKARERKRGRR